MTRRYYVSDSELSERFPIYTRANVGEVFPDPVTPATSTMALFASELGWRDAWVRIGAFDADEFPADAFCQIGVTGGYCYLNASVTRVFGERAPGLSWEAMDQQLFGVMPGVPPYQEMPGDARPDLAAGIGATFAAALAVRHVDELTELTDDRARTIGLRAERPDLERLGDVELFARAEHLVDDHHRELFGHHLYASFVSSVPIGMLGQIAAAVGRADLVMPILAGLGDVDSAAPSYALWDLSRLDPLSDEYADGFAAFLRDFGSRGPNEWEARSPTWETDPALAVAAIELMRLAPATMSPREQNRHRAAEREAAISELLALVEGDPDVHGQLAAAIGACGAWLPARERTKTNNIRLIHELRVTMRELGRRMVARGAFDEIEDFGFVVKSEWPAFLADPHRFTDTVRARRAEYRALYDKVPPFVFVGEPADPATWPAKDAVAVDQLVRGDVLAGLPGCPGVAEGIARVVLDSHDPSALEPGDILVAPITDPSWTPLFVPAGGVVVDVGAMMSHAVIVSRELGIPCVVSATDATRRIPNGARVRVDGANGTVTLV